MRLYLEVIEGPYAGKKFTLSEKTSFGRAGTGIALDDPKLSGTHAFFDYSPKKGWGVFDNESRNGVWVNGHREPKALLQNGDIVQMGQVVLRCRLTDGEVFQFSQEFKDWFKTLPEKVINKSTEVTEINPEIRLKVIQGNQYGESWDIFYGPRKAGKSSNDICLRDEQALLETFEIHVKGKYAYFYTDHENLVKLNNKQVKEKQFTPGDVISFGETKILVEVDEGHGFSY